MMNITNHNFHRFRRKGKLCIFSQIPKKRETMMLLKLFRRFRRKGKLRWNRNQIFMLKNKVAYKLGEPMFWFSPIPKKRETKFFTDSEEKGNYVTLSPIPSEKGNYVTFIDSEEKRNYGKCFTFTLIAFRQTYDLPLQDPLRSYVWSGPTHYVTTKRTHALTGSHWVTEPR